MLNKEAFKNIFNFYFLRVSYVELIRPFAMKFVPNRGNMMNRVLAQPNVEIPLVTGPILPEQGLGTVTTKLKSQVRVCV